MSALVRRARSARAFVATRLLVRPLAQTDREAIVERVVLVGSWSFGGAMLWAGLYRVLVPAVSIAMLLTYVLFVYFVVLVLSPALRVVALLGTAAWVVFCECVRLRSGTSGRSTRNGGR